MNQSLSPRATLVVSGAVLLIVLANGCGKQSPSDPGPDANPAAAAPAPAPGAAPVAGQPAAAASTDAAASLAAAQAAMQVKDYERAAAALLAVQQLRQPLTPAQGEAMRNQMVQLQQSVATGLASGDPKARAAADLLRKSTMR